MRIYYINSFDGITLTASSESAPNISSNVQQQHLSQTWKTTGITAENIKGNTGSLTPSGSFIAGHNLTASAVVKIEGHSSDVWTSPNVSITMTRGDNYYYAFTGFTEQAFWRFTFVDTTNTDGYIEIGRAWLGASVEVDVPSKQFTEKYIDTTNVDFSITGQPYGDIGFEYRMFDVNFPKNTEAQKAIWKNYYHAVRRSMPHFINSAVGMETKLEPLYCILESDLELRNIKTLQLWGTLASYREAK